MKTVTMCLLVVAALVLGGCSSGESYVKPGYQFGRLDNVAVVEVQGDVHNQGEKDQIADFLNVELLKKGYAPVERAHIQTLLKEQEFQASELTTSAGAARAGQLLNVPAVVVISIPKFGEEMSMTVKMMEVETGSIVWMGSGEGNTGRTLGTIFGAVAGAVIGAGVSGDDDKVLGGVAGGVGGAVLGRALTPQKAKMVKTVVGKICKSLPPRISVQ